MATYLYRARPTRPEMLAEGLTPAEEAAVDAHFERLKALADKGVVQFAGRTLKPDAEAFGIVVFTAESDAEAQAIMEADPAVTSGVMRAELFPFRIVIPSGNGLT